MNPKVMRDSSQTVITTIRSAINVWRRRQNWSRETVVLEIVAKHYEIGGMERTGIVFNPETQDGYERAKVNADRVYRWLDDETKDTNLLPANFLPSIISALPLDLRLTVVDELLADSGLHADVSQQEINDAPTVAHLRAILKECAEAAASVGDLAGNEEDEGLLAAADKELAEAAAAIERTRVAVMARRNR